MGATPTSYTMEIGIPDGWSLSDAVNFYSAIKKARDGVATIGSNGCRQAFEYPGLTNFNVTGGSPRDRTVWVCTISEEYASALREDLKDAAERASGMPNYPG